MWHVAETLPHFGRVQRLAVGNDEHLNFVRREVLHQRQVYSYIRTALIASVQEQQPNGHTESKPMEEPARARGWLCCITNDPAYGLRYRKV